MMVAYLPWIHAVGIGLSLFLSALIILLVLVQEEKGGGLTGAFGGSGSISTFGVETSRQTARYTWIFFTAWLIISLVIAINARDRHVTLKPGSTATAPATSPEPVDE